MEGNPGPKGKLIAKPSSAPSAAPRLSPQSRMLDTENVCAKLIANGRENPTLTQLFETTGAIGKLGHEDPESARAIMLFSCAWARHLRNATFREAEDSIPALNRFISSLFAFASNARAELSIQALDAAELLFRYNAPAIANAFAKLLASERRGEVREAAVSILEKNAAFMFRPDCINGIGELLREYEEGPLSFNPILSRTASAFLFAWKNQLFERERRHLIAYAAGWAEQVEPQDRIILMIDVYKQLKKEESADILARTADMTKNPLIRIAALDLLLQMGVSRHTYKNYRGEEVEARRVNHFLQMRLLEQTLPAINSQEFAGKSLVVGKTAYLIMEGEPGAPYFHSSGAILQ